MAKVSFTKLGLTKNQEVKTIEYNGQTIEIKQYLSIGDKIQLISNAINFAMDENNFVDSLKLSTFLILEIIDFYTNINFTEKQREEPTKLYDLMVGNNFKDRIFENIPEKEIKELTYYSEQIAKAYYNYKNSIYGVLKSVSEDYSNLNLDAESLQKNIADPENLTLLKDVMEKLG